MRRSLSKTVCAASRRCGYAVQQRVRAFSCILFALGTAVCFMPSNAAAQGEEVLSHECCTEMFYPVSARVAALGQALTATSGADAPFINPAGLADLTKTVAIAHRTTAGDASLTTFEFVYHSRVAGTFGLTYSGMQFSTDEATDSTGATRGTFNYYRQTIIVSYATGVGLGWTAGVNYRLFVAGTSCSSGNCGDAAKTGTTQMIDAGLRFAPRVLHNLLLGVSVMHAGMPLQVNNAAQADPTPVRLRVGGAYNIRSLLSKDSSIAAWVSGDLVQRIRDTGTPALNLGLEVILDNTIFLRAGHASEAGGINQGGNGVGLGLKYQRYDVNVAKGVSGGGPFPDPVYVSFGISF
jgi:hypothetical protein